MWAVDPATRAIAGANAAARAIAGLGSNDAIGRPVDELFESDVPGEAEWLPNGTLAGWRLRAACGGLAGTRLTHFTVATETGPLIVVSAAGASAGDSSTAVLEQQAEELRLLYKAGQSLGATLDPDEIYDTMQALVSQSMDCDSLLVSSFDPESEQIRCVYAWIEGIRLDADTFPPMPLAPPGEGVQSEVIRTGTSLLVKDADESYKGKRNRVYVDSDGTVRNEPALDKPRTRSLLMVPIKLGGRVLGIVHVASNRPLAYTTDHQRLLEAMVLQMAAAGRNAYLYRQMHDELREREQREAEIAQLNSRLQRALTETHHRVKNNLQLVVGLIEMLLVDDERPVRQADVNRLAQHVRSLAAIHEVLTKLASEEAEMDRIPARQLLGRLQPHLRQIADTRSVSFDIADLPLSVRQGASVAILLTELVNNSLKHGAGAIQISLTRDDDFVVLQVSDEGAGFPPGFDSRVAGATGLDLVDRISAWDLSGAVAYLNTPQGGAAVRVSFPPLRQATAALA